MSAREDIPTRPPKPSHMVDSPQRCAKESNLLPLETGHPARILSATGARSIAQLKGVTEEARPSSGTSLKYIKVNGARCCANPHCPARYMATMNRVSIGATNITTIGISTAFSKDGYSLSPFRCGDTKNTEQVLDNFLNLAATGSSLAHHW
ncbi:hypothetical protein BJV82DRAFT_582752 [Fennellomyces sp. T-0311]|nr:hypothetical protein BJV82DRAFT_582752 [Fennellomyces sp. T-0311]